MTWLMLAFALFFSKYAPAQKVNQTDKETLRQLNDFIKKSFSETYKSQGDSTFVDLDSKKGNPTTTKYEGRLVNFKGCNISFFSSSKRESPKSDFSENVSFSLKYVDLEKTYVSNDSYFSDKDGAMTLHFRTKENHIRSQGQFLSIISRPNPDNYIPLTKIMSQYFVVLKTSANIEEIRNALQNSVKICQKD